jgi:hypothetical protein
MSERRQADGTWNVQSREWPGVYGAPDNGVARSIQCLVGNRSLVDVGAGAGQYGAWFAGCDPYDAQPKWSGYEGNADIEEFSRRGPPGAFTRHLNLCNTSASALPVHDWAMTLEVGEHLPTECIPRYISLLNATARYGIVLSWGSDKFGRGHINPKHLDEVVQLMAAAGWTINHAASMWVRGNAYTVWLRRHVGVYLRNHTSLADALARDVDLPLGALSRSQLSAIRACPVHPAEMHKTWRKRLANSYGRVNNCTAMRQHLQCRCALADKDSRPAEMGFPNAIDSPAWRMEIQPDKGWGGHG